MRRTLAAACLSGLLVVGVGSPAFAGINEGNGRGNPDTTESGHCPPGQNKDTSPGGWKKCS